MSDERKKELIVIAHEHKTATRYIRETLDHSVIVLPTYLQNLDSYFKDFYQSDEDNYFSNLSLDFKYKMWVYMKGGRVRDKDEDLYLSIRIDDIHIKSWGENYRKEVEEDGKRYEVWSEKQRELKRLDPLLTSKFEINSFDEVYFFPTREKTLQCIFDQLEVSFTFPLAMMVNYNELETKRDKEYIMGDLLKEYSDTYYKAHTSYKKDIYKHFEIEDLEKLILEIKEREYLYVEKPFIHVLYKEKGVNIVIQEDEYTHKLMRVYIKYSDGDKIKSIKEKVKDELLGIHLTLYEKTNYNGFFNILKHDFSVNFTLIADMLFTAPLFKDFLINQESDKATKEKDNLSLYYIEPWNQFKNGNDPDNREYRENKITFSITNQSDGLRIQITRCKNVEKFKYVITRIFATYDKIKDTIIKSYNDILNQSTRLLGVSTLLSTEEGKKKGKTKQKKSGERTRFEILKDELSYLFTTSYTSSISCQNNQLPKFYDTEEEANRAVEELKVKFGKDDLYSLGFPSDEHLQELKQTSKGKEVIKKWYVCDQDKKFVYPGLKSTENKKLDKDYLFNNSYVPCCFKKNQQTKKGNAWDKYFNKVIKEKTISKLIKSNKILVKGQTGELKDNIHLLLEAADPLNTYVRHYTPISPHSFIESVLLSLGKDTNDLQTIRNELTQDDALLNVVKQECFDMTLQEIKEFIQSERYFDPRLFTRLLEEKYKCNILVFERNKSIPKGNILKRRSKYYLSSYLSDTQLDSVLIIEHTGGVTYQTSYPHCEYILKKSSGQMDSKIFRILSQNFEKMDQLPYKIMDIIIPFKSEDLESQYIDDYGKTRVLKLKTGLYVETSPLPPLPLPLFKMSQIKKSDLNSIYAFAQTYRLRLQSQKILNNNVVSLCFVRDGVEYIVHLKTSCTKMEGVLTQDYLSYISVNKHSKYRQWLQMKKITQHILEEARFALSKKLNEDQSEVNPYIFIYTYIQENTVIDKNFKYANLNDEFGKKRGVFNENGKLVLVDNEMKQNVLYTLFLDYVRNKNNLVDKYKRLRIHKDYNSLLDFTPHRNEALFYGLEAFLGWLG